MSEDEWLAHKLEIDEFCQADRVVQYKLSDRLEQRPELLHASVIGMGGGVVAACLLYPPQH